MIHTTHKAQEPAPKRRYSRENRAIVQQAIIDLTNANRVVSRTILSAHTGLEPSIVADHVRTMKEDGLIRSVPHTNGIIELTHSATEDRAISMTYLPQGGCKLEIGDACIELTMREARILGMAAGGVSLAFSR